MRSVRRTSGLVLVGNLEVGSHGGDPPQMWGSWRPHPDLYSDRFTVLRDSL